MESNDTLEIIRSQFASKDKMSIDYYVNNILEEFLENMQYSVRDINKINHNCKSHDCIIDNTIIIRFYVQQGVKKAINELVRELNSGKGYEWAILIHEKGVWLLNRDIYCGDESFTDDKIALAISFESNKDNKYFKYLSYDNLIGKYKNARFFADITEYKNKNFNSTNQSSWSAYSTALKRFFDFYAENKGNYSGIQYSDITFSNFEEYVKESSNINSETTAKNQFFYIKGFMISRTGPDGEFARESDELLSRCKDILRSKNDDIVEIDPEQITELIAALSKDRNGTRNITLFLMLLGLGIERRKLCSMKWDEDISKNMKYLKINNNCYIVIPKVIVKYLQELRMEEPEDAIYVFGNCTTGCMIPLKEGSINGMLDRITKTIKNKKGINMITPAVLRRWLFLYLLDNGYRLQDVMCMMNISVENLGSYINDKKLKTYSDIGTWNTHPMDKFFADVQI